MSSISITIPLRRILLMAVAALALLIVAAHLSPLATNAQTSSVTAEAIGQANLRAWTDTTADRLGEIVTGTRYPVIGRSALYPWLLLGDPTTLQPLGWAYSDLLTVQGDLNTVPVTEITVTPGSAAPVPPTATTQLVVVAPTPTLGAVGVAATPSVTGSPAAVTATPQPVQPSVRGMVEGEINIRYGPGVEYPRLGVANAGDVLAITGWHTQLPWVQISYPASPTGLAWVNRDVITIEGDLTSLPPISQLNFNLPTLTPTPSVLENVPVLGATPVAISPEFHLLGDQLWAMMLDAGFDPATSRLGAMFLMDLQTGESVSFDSQIAFSGMSVNKIAILTTLYSQLSSPPDDQTAYTIGEAMVCSENISTNQMLSIIGNGNPYTGAESVSAFLESLGLQYTFIYTPYANDPYITPQAPRLRTTDANQTAAEPDPYNQMTVNEMGGLLNSLYQCSQNGDGPLINTGQFTQTECRQMIAVMNGNRIGNLIEAGIPANVPISHKHGWIDDTHGDAAIVFSPGGAYVFVVVLHNPTWLNFDESSTLIAEMSRTIYNYFNPTAPMAEVRYESVPATCDMLGNPILNDLQDPYFGQ
ncbi:MAG: serine hydrolase [Anaerolineae bacterium]